MIDICSCKTLGATNGAHECVAQLYESIGGFIGCQHVVLHLSTILFLLLVRPTLTTHCARRVLLLECIADSHDTNAPFPHLSPCKCSGILLLLHSYLCGDQVLSIDMLITVTASQGSLMATTDEACMWTVPQGQLTHSIYSHSHELASANCREVIANKSKAAAGLCDWAINIVKYFDVVAEVEPKRAELAAANGKLNDANATLKTVQDKVAGLNAQVRSLEEAYSKVRALPRPFLELHAFYAGLLHDLPSMLQLPDGTNLARAQMMRAPPGPASTSLKVDHLCVHDSCTGASDSCKITSRP